MSKTNACFGVYDQSRVVRTTVFDTVEPALESVGIESSGVAKNAAHEILCDRTSKAYLPVSPLPTPKWYADA